MLYYFAYGSNLHPLRLKQRTPSAQPFAVAVLRRYRLAFHKRGMDGSGKCNLIYSGLADDAVYGVIYRLARHERKLLDRYEGPGYRVASVVTTVNGLNYQCFTYLARKSHIVASFKPFDWYRELVLRGAVLHGFPPDYIRQIATQETRTDNNHSRTSQHWRLLHSMAELSSRGR
jgi:hypothetical protein